MTMQDESVQRGLNTEQLKKVMAVSSPGGHWEQLTSIRTAFEGTDVLYVTTSEELAKSLGHVEYRVVSDCNRDQPLKLVRCFIETFLIVLKTRPDVVVTTGAAPGLFAVASARILGAKTIWIDSLANTERMSMSGRIAARFVTLTVTQWEHISRPDGPRYFGEIL